MVTVAVAGGSGNLGLTIVEALQQSKHKVIVIVRKSSKAQIPDVPVFNVDYSDVEAVARVLEENNVHTVISALSVRGPEEAASESSLVKAAAKSSATKRFMASEYGTLAPTDKNLQLPQHPARQTILAELQQTDLEWTRLHDGYFMDYYGIPHIESHMQPIAFGVDMYSKAAGIPGTGNDKISFTYTKDVAKFVVAALDLEKWDEAMFCYGDVATWNEVLKIAEEVRGSKFTVAYDSVEDLEKGQITDLPFNEHVYPFFPKPMFQQYFGRFGLYVTMGFFDFSKQDTLNKKFPDIKTTSVREMLSVWKGK